MKAWFLEVERSVEIINPSMDDKLEPKLQRIQIPQFARSPFCPEAFSNGVEIMQLDSTVLESFKELDVTDTGGKVVGSDKSCIAISHREKKNTVSTKERKCTMAKNEISLEDIQQHFDQKRLDAAKSLGVSVSTLKRISRKHGISRWPFHNKKNRLVTESVQGAVRAFSPTKTSHIDVVGSNYQDSQGSKPPEPQHEKKMLPSCKMLPLFGRQAEIAAQMLENNLSAHEGQLEEQNSFHIERQDARIVIIKATYGDDIVRLKFPSTSRIVELKEELVEKLELEHGSFNVKYQDEELDWVLITCDADLHECVTSSSPSSSSIGNQVIKLLVHDKIANFRNSSKATEH